MLKQRRLQSLLCIILVIAMLLTATASADSLPTLTLSDPNEEIITENIEVENIEVEDIITETRLTSFITEEVYLEEIIVAEDKITELLLEEEMIDEVLLCKTIYVPQENIEEFAQNSQTAQLFGDGFNITSALKKFAIGTGIIVTVTVLKKVGLRDPVVVSIVNSAAEESLKLATTGAVIGTLFGGLTGAADEIDPSGRTSAVLGFAIATAGLIISAIHLVGLIPSGGASAVGLTQGIKLVIAGVGVVTGASATVKTGYGAIKAFTATDADEIDWDNINWERVGVSAAEQAINNGADGYMLGAIVGTVYGGAEGYDYYHKFNAPYTSKKDRIAQASGNKGGHWSGEVGESDFILDEPIELPDGTKVTKITYRNGIPDFSTVAEAEVKIPEMTKDRRVNFEQADEALAEKWTKLKHDRHSWTSADVRAYRAENKLSWHEMSNMDSMQLVSRDVHGTFKHYGGVAECNVAFGQGGGVEFD